MNEVIFPAKLRNGGKVRIITVPKEIIDFYDLGDEELYEIIIRQKPVVQKIKMSFLGFLHGNLWGLAV